MMQQRTQPVPRPGPRPRPGWTYAEPLGWFDEREPVPDPGTPIFDQLWDEVFGGCGGTTGGAGVCDSGRHHRVTAAARP